MASGTAQGQIQVKGCNMANTGNKANKGAKGKGTATPTPQAPTLAQMQRTAALLARKPYSIAQPQGKGLVGWAVLVAHATIPCTAQVAHTAANLLLAKVTGNAVQGGGSTVLHRGMGSNKRWYANKGWQGFMGGVVAKTLVMACQQHGNNTHKCNKGCLYGVRVVGGTTFVLQAASGGRKRKATPTANVATPQGNGNAHPTTQMHKGVNTVVGGTPTPTPAAS